VEVDGLSAFFLVVIGVLAAVAAWYSVTYTRGLRGSLRAFYPPLLLFVLGMAGVVVVNDFLFFFVPWEFMALSSYLLVIFHKDQAESLRAGFKYFFITHTGTLALLFGVCVLATIGGGSFQFSSIAASMGGLLASRAALTNFALALIFLGFLVKAGAFPVGMWWLPDAYSAAPSPASAMLGGIMSKLGLYGILRVFFFLTPAGSWSLAWGLVIAAFGALSMFYGTMTALVQHDSKRLLSYHAIGQVGYMLLAFGIGLGLIQRNPALAAVALLAGLFHLLNNACFKSLLFLNAGTFEHATGERDLNLLGGLGKLLPLTAACTVVASLSIAGLPPTNGFASKWLIYNSSVWGSQGIGVLFLLFGIVAIFISAVTLASFLKFMGASIWGSASPLVVSSKRVNEWPWLAPSQLSLAGLCLALGLFPYAGLLFCYKAMAGASVTAAVGSFASLFGSGPLQVQVFNQGSVAGLWTPVVMGAIFVACFGLALLVRRSAAAPRRSVVTWTGGSEVATEELRFRADSYYTPFKRFVAVLIPAWRPNWRLRPRPGLLKVLNPDQWAYQPLVRGLLAFGRWAARSRIGLPQVYPAWTLIGLALSLVFLLLWWRF
jgi:hydrogenase-4 component B